MNKYGTNGHLDLMTVTVPQRLRKAFHSLKKGLFMNTRFEATFEERYMLMKISRRNTTPDFEVFFYLKRL